MVNDKINDDIKMHLRRAPFQRPCGCAGAIQTALPDAACPGLPWKPLDDKLIALDVKVILNLQTRSMCIV